MSLWASSFRHLVTQLGPGSVSTVAGVRGQLRIAATAGNIAVVIGTRQLFPGPGAVAIVQSSQEKFRPTVELQRDGSLSITSRPAMASFARQRARINTLVFAPPEVTSLDISLVAGEAWVFGEAVGSSALESCSARVILGDVTMVDVAARKLSGRTRLGDVRIALDGQAASSAPCAVSGSYLLGGALLTIAGKGRMAPPWIVPEANLRVRVVERPARRHLDRDEPWLADNLRAKWLEGTGAEFFVSKVEPLLFYAVHALPLRMLLTAVCSACALVPR